MSNHVPQFLLYYDKRYDLYPLSDLEAAMIRRVIAQDVKQFLKIQELLAGTCR